MRERGERVLGLGARVGDVEPERGRDLVVARAAGVDLAADVAEQPLDRRVDVLVGARVDLVDRARAALDLGELVVVEDPGRVQPLARAACVAWRSYGSSSASSARRNSHTSGASAVADAARPERHSDQPERREHPPRVGDVVDLHRELADAVGGGERGRAALHAQPLRVVGERLAARVEDRVVVAAAQLDRRPRR